MAGKRNCNAAFCASPNSPQRSPAVMAGKRLSALGITLGNQLPQRSPAVMAGKRSKLLWFADCVWTTRNGARP